jgi:hypothetical protein
MACETNSTVLSKFKPPQRIARPDLDIEGANFDVCSKQAGDHRHH